MTGTLPSLPPGSHLRCQSRAVKITTHLRHSLSNSTRKVTHPSVGPCVRNRCHPCHLQRGPPGLGSNSHWKLKYNYMCNPTQMSLDVTETITLFSYCWRWGVKASQLAPYTQSLGPPGRGGDLQGPQGGVKGGAVPSYPRVSTLHRHLLNSGGQASWRQGDKEMEDQVPSLSLTGCVTSDNTPPLSGPQWSPL